jgi:hypothetical protein
MPYHPLNKDQEDIRVLTIAPQPDPDSGLVVCTLEQVSLRDLSPMYQEYISGLREDTPAWELLDGWANISGDHAAGHDRKLFHIPDWRWAYHRDLIGPDYYEHQLYFQMEDNGEPWIHPGGSHVPTTSFASTSILPRYTWGDFEALSYCWESENLENRIVIDGTPTSVPKNLESALRALQQLPETHAGMKFWVDYLCIDQNDTIEKNHQVKLMRKIYGNALSVVAWLGNEREGSAEAIELIWQIDLLPGGVLFGESFINHEHWMSSSKWESLHIFLSRSYWKRLWIIQELVLNHNLSLFLCGNEAIPRKVIMQACDFCMEERDEIDKMLRTRSAADGDEVVEPSDLENGVFPRSFAVGRLLELRRSADLDTILDVGRKANSKYAKDKVYGLLALLPEVMQAEILPDYTAVISLETVFINFANLLLETTGKLDSILSWCSYTPNNGLPSFVPDWRLPFKRHHLYWLKKRAASRQTEPQWETCQSPPRLICKGIIVDNIATTGFSLEVEAGRTHHRRTVSRPNAVPAKLPPNRYVGKRSVRSALLRTLMADHPKRSSGRAVVPIPVDPDDPELSALWTCGMDRDTKKSDWWPLFDSFRQINASFSVLGFDFCTFFPDMSANSSSLEFLAPADLGSSVTRDLRLATLSLFDRKLAITTTGYLGLVAGAARTGDAIAVLYGCNFPVVLRRTGKEFIYIGECYIDGIMDREVLDGEYDEVDVTLC